MTAIIAFLMGQFTPLIIILIFFEAIDYITGITSAVKRSGGVSKHEAIWGFIKKFSYFIVVFVAFCFDFVIIETCRLTDINFEWPSVFGILSICYLISTEGISILENLEEIGVVIPFLTSALKVYREKVVKKNGGIV